MNDEPGKPLDDLINSLVRVEQQLWFKSSSSPERKLPPGSLIMALDPASGADWTVKVVRTGVELTLYDIYGGP